MSEIIEASEEATYPMFKDGGWVKVRRTTTSDTFKKSQAYDLIGKERIFAVDTESTLKKKVLTTDLIPVAFFDRQTVIDERDGQNTIERFLALVCERYGVDMPRPSRTRQRRQLTLEERRERRRSRRDGRRQSIPITVSIWFNLPYDMSRLFPHHEHLRRIYSGSDSYIMKVSERFEIEWTSYIDTSAPQFAWYIRDHEEKRIVRLLGVDLTGYWKCSLDAALSDVGLKGKEDIEAEVENVHEREFESFSETEIAARVSYAMRDADRTGALLHKTVELLTEIDPRVVRRTGLIPPSAPGAAARILFAKAFDQHPDIESWKRPPVWADRLGAEAYYGGRAFCANPGRYEGCVSLDLKSAYPAVMTMLPDPVTAEYVQVPPAKSFDYRDWRGKFGVLKISGRCRDPIYPTFRIHDDERLRYVMGDFKEISVTIPEIVIGVVRGSLEVDEIHDGVWIKGSNSKSFFRAFVLELYAMKEKHGRSPLGLLAKLLMNSSYGKLIEVNANEFRWELVVPVPNFRKHKNAIAKSVLAILVSDGDVDSDVLFFGQVHEDVKDERASVFDARVASLHGAIDVVHEYMELLDQFSVSDAPGTVPLIEFLRDARLYKAGAFFMPIYAAQITGFVSAQLGMMASCTGALAGDTDAVHLYSPDPSKNPLDSRGVQQYFEFMQAAGYEAPRKGAHLIEGSTLGTWENEAPCPSKESFFSRLKRYSHYFVHPTEGESYKQATHGIARFTCPEAELAFKDTSLSKKERIDKARFLRQKALHALMGELVDGQEPEYETRRAPRKGRSSIRGGVAGEFVSNSVVVSTSPVPHTYQRSDGWVVWESFEDSPSSLVSS